MIPSANHTTKTTALAHHPSFRWLQKASLLHASAFPTQQRADWTVVSVIKLCVESENVREYLAYSFGEACGAAAETELGNAQTDRLEALR